MAVLKLIKLGDIICRREFIGEGLATGEPIWQDERRENDSVLRVASAGPRNLLAMAKKVGEDRYDAWRLGLSLNRGPMRIILVNGGDEYDITDEVADEFADTDAAVPVTRRLRTVLEAYSG